MIAFKKRRRQDANGVFLFQNQIWYSFAGAKLGDFFEKKSLKKLLET